MKSLADRGYERVNGVWARDLKTFAYSDGDEVEERLAAAVDAVSDVSLHSEELASHVVDWPTRYHFGPERANLVRPLEAQLRGATVLEIGAGCGAVTRYFGEVGAKVIAVEGSVRRARIASARCRDLPTVAVVAQPFDDFNCEERFDFVTLIGVLEYARIYSLAMSADPILAMLRRAGGFLKPGGKLILAIENQLGLKYFAGHPEDHLGTPFVGIEDCYEKDGVVTFGRVELQRLLNSAGLRFQSWLYPFPDYKLPVAVLSDRAIKTPHAPGMIDVLVSAIEAEPQPIDAPVFDMGGAVEALARNELLPHLSNSFLVVASASASSEEFFAETYSTGRRPAFRKSTGFVPVSDALEVRRKRFCPPLPLVHDGVSMTLLPTERMKPGCLWSSQLKKIARRQGWTLAELIDWSAVWQDAFCVLAGIPASASPDTVVPGYCVDAVPRNLLVAGNESGFIDLEWSVDWPLTYADLLYRSIFTPLAALKNTARPADNIPLGLVELFTTVTAALGCSIDLETLAKAERKEDAFIAGAVGASLSVATLRERALHVRMR